MNKNNDIKYRYGFCLVAIQRYLVSFFCFRRKGVDKLGSVKKIRHKLNFFADNNIEKEQER